jgi:SulP family sulfate permease
MASYFASLKPGKSFVKDAVAGFSTGLFSIPEGMAYAQLAGVNPVYGLYSGMVATLVAALSTGTILMISTLTSAIALSVGSVIASAGYDSSDQAALFTVTFLVGTYMFVAGLLRLGKLVSFVSNAVMTGFVMGASLLIIIGELGDFSGYEPVGANDLAEVVNWFTNIPNWDPTTTLVGLATLISVLVLKRIKQTEKMASIIVLILMTVVVTVLSLDVELVGDIVDIPSSLPAPMLPDFSAIPDLALGSLSVAIVALVQGAGISTAYPNPDKSKSSQSHDFIGEGLGNLVGSFFQSMATGGSLSRSGISVSGGARSRWGGIFAALWLALIVLLFGQAAELVPMSVIAGLLFVIGAELIMARIPSFVLVHRTSVGAAAALWITFLSALFIPLQWTIFLGAGLSLILYVWASSQKVDAHELTKRAEDGRYEEHEIPESLPSGKATIISLGGIDFFAEVPVLDENLPDALIAENAVVILRLRGTEHIGSTAIKWLERYNADLREGGNLLMLAGVQPELMEELEKTGMLEEIGKENVFAAQSGLGAAEDAALEAADKWLAEYKSEQEEEDAS